jgi:bifunctional non-homologous end joining protein LigD
MSLREYKAKRDFQRSPEPRGRTDERKELHGPNFVVQKHAASHLHYDFRLELEGVLKSWAVPKGFPTRRGEKHLAIQVEDHPFDYRDFEGTIPEGSYGAGTVMVWDKGTYEVVGGAPMQALQSGKLHFILHGKKLKGEWALIRMRSTEREQKPQWLLLKSVTDLPPLSKSAAQRSVISRRTLDQIASAQVKRVWSSNRGANGKSESRKLVRQQRATAPEDLHSLAESLGIDLRELPKAPARYVEPMKALLRDELPKGEDWVYEVKFDGVRGLLVKNEKALSLFSRTEKNLSLKYPAIMDALRRLAADQAVLDGEVVALDPEGRSSFQLLQSYHRAGSRRPPLLYYVFDLLNLQGRDLSGLPLWQRKAMAQALVASLRSTVRFSPSIQADSERLVKEMKNRGLEGLVAKRKDSTYESGRRTGAWVKFKWTREQEFVIGGYTRPKGAREHFGAILIGYYQGKQLIFAAKVGTGFDEQTLARLHHTFQKLTRPDCPFANLPEKRSTSGGLTATEMKACTWLEPRLVCQVRFSEWTRDHHLRQPAFLGLREDKNAKEVVREEPA